jgi:hypothetical protein
MVFTIFIFMNLVESAIFSAVGTLTRMARDLVDADGSCNGPEMLTRVQSYAQHLELRPKGKTGLRALETDLRAYVAASASSESRAGFAA